MVDYDNWGRIVAPDIQHVSEQIDLATLEIVAPALATIQTTAKYALLTASAPALPALSNKEKRTGAVPP